MLLSQGPTCLLQVSRDIQIPSDIAIFLKKGRSSVLSWAGSGTKVYKKSILSTQIISRMINHRNKLTRGIVASPFWESQFKATRVSQGLRGGRFVL